MSPPNHNGSVAGFIIRICCAINCAGVSTTFLRLWAMLLSSSYVGQPCCTCQRIFGKAMANAITPPSQIHFCVKWRRSGVSRSARKMPLPEERHRMLVLETEPGEHTEPEPESRRTPVDDADHQINASHPENRLERVHGKEIAVDQKHERAKRRRAAERDCPVASAQFACDRAGERDRSRAC